MRLVVRIPNWVGDAVMATPAFEALRKRFPDDEIVAVGKGWIRDLLGGTGWFDRCLLIGKHLPAGTIRRGLALRREGPFDAGLLLTNSLGSALVMRLAGVRRRIGYAREGRSILLTDRLQPQRDAKGFVPGPMVDYYCTLAEVLTGPIEDRRYRLAVEPGPRQRMQEILQRKRRHRGRPMVVVNPGAAFGAAKCYPPARFAEVVTALAERGDVEVVIVCGPAERDVARRIDTLSQGVAVCLEDEPVPLGELKALVQDAALLITNDSGPRHFAYALDTPVVTVFGPTERRWTESGYENERIVAVAERDHPPCMNRTCRRGDHKCMMGIDPRDVVRAAEALLSEPSTGGPR